MANTIVAVIERAGRISVANAQAKYTEVVVGFIRTRHKAAIDAKLTLHGHANYIPAEGEE